MKRWKRLSAWVFILGFSLSLTMTTGCSEDPVDPVSTCDPDVMTNQIIMNPLTPSPGDTTQLTIQSEGEGCDNWAKYTWTVEGGELVQETGITVRWVAPMEYGTYGIQCRATLEGAKPDTARTMALVRNVEYLNTRKIASVRPSITGNSLYFIAEEGNVGPSRSSFRGWAVFDLSSSGVVTLVTDTRSPSNAGAYEFDFINSNNLIYGSFITTYFVGLRQQKMNVFKFPQGELSVNVSDDFGGLIYDRKNQHRYPKANAAGDKVVWKFQFVGQNPAGTEDLFNIAFWDGNDGPGDWYTITQSHDSATAIIGPDTVMQHRYYNNIRPMFTPSEDNILYFVDTSGVFEPCLIPMSGGEPDTLLRRALMVTENTGIFRQAGSFISERTVFQWNPTTDFLSFVSGGMIVFFDYSSETVAKITELTGVTEFAWAPDGSQLAAINDVGIFLVGASGAVSPDPVFTKERSTDGIKGVSWNNDGTQLAFRMIRKGKSAIDSWSALVVVDLNSGLWAYASTPFGWHSSREFANIDYTWLRTLFDEDGTGIYAPVPVLDDVNYPGKEIILIYSHE